MAKNGGIRAFSVKSAPLQIYGKTRNPPQSHTLTHHKHNNNNNTQLTALHPLTVKECESVFANRESAKQHHTKRESAKQHTQNPPLALTRSPRSAWRSKALRADALTRAQPPWYLRVGGVRALAPALKL